MQERTTKELIETLGADFQRCYGNIIQSFDEGTIDEKGLLAADYEFHARQLSMTYTLNLQRHALSPAVADLGSR